MKAYQITITAPETAALLVTDVAVEPLPPDHIRGRTLCTLMSPGTELAANFMGTSFPNKPGYSAVYVVEEVGTAVKTLQPGDHVFAMGKHRSDQQHWEQDIIPVPAGLAPEVAVLARLMNVSMTTLTTTRARPGDLVVISGAGPVGFLAAQQFRLAGYQVQVVEPDDARRVTVVGCGFTAHPRMPVESLKGQVSLVVECSGHEQAVLDGCQVVRRRGEVVLVGVPWRKRTDLTAHDILHAVFHRYVDLRSGWEWELPIRADANSPHSLNGNFAKGLRWLHEGRIQTTGLIDLFHPADCQTAYELNLRHENAGLFTVFDWRQTGTPQER